MFKNKINLISDTVTLPSKGMLDAMINAKLGDDVFREDPTVIELEEKLSGMFGMEAGLFCPSGTMCNQIAIKGHTQPLDEMLCDINSHVYQFEVGGYAFLSQIAVNAIQGNQGILTAQHLQDNIKAKQDWLPRTKLVVLENSGNRSGGNCYNLDQLKEISEFCRNNNLSLHLDGARIFNALIAKNLTPIEIGPLFDSISICLSKGLGTPAGSVLIGKKDWINDCRRIRKVLGGGMRQAGILAAAGLYALDNNIDRLREDHSKAQRIEGILKNAEYVESIFPVETNIIIFQLKENVSPQNFVDTLKTHGINSSAFGKRSVRFVTHMDITDEMMNEVENTLSSFKM
ncbi:MAG: aminotransferase class I/II-fold pyridoxal phosphate-dependent enzyme [Saprospiraceae bacterium]|nr:aminotransferase class I/II-fold pyridoxal phosphate-dependent enzyme [Saprospiraceae bacterium]